MKATKPPTTIGADGPENRSPAGHRHPRLGPSGSGPNRSGGKVWNISTLIHMRKSLCACVASGSKRTAAGTPAICARLQDARLGQGAGPIMVVGPASFTL